MHIHTHILLQMYADVIPFSNETARHAKPTLAPSFPADPGAPRGPVGPAEPVAPRSPGRPLSP